MFTLLDSNSFVERERNVDKVPLKNNSQNCTKENDSSRQCQKTTKSSICLSKTNIESRDQRGHSKRPSKCETISQD